MFSAEESLFWFLPWVLFSFPEFAGFPLMPYILTFNSLLCSIGCAVILPPHSLSLCHPVTHTAREAWILWVTSPSGSLPTLLRVKMLIYIGKCVCCCSICEITTSRHSLPKWFSFLLTHRHSHRWSNRILSIFLSINYWFISLLLQIVTNFK